MDLGTILDDLLPGGAIGATGELDALVNSVERSGRPVRAVRAASKEWPPPCATGLCGTQGCVCRTRGPSFQDMACFDADFELSLEAHLDGLGVYYTGTPVASVAPRPSESPGASPARTEAGPRGRGQPRKKARKAPRDAAPTPPRARPVQRTGPLTNLVQEAEASLRDEAEHPRGRKVVRDLSQLFRSRKPRGVAHAAACGEIESLFCYESLECDSLTQFMCYETLPPRTHDTAWTTPRS